MIIEKSKPFFGEEVYRGARRGVVVEVPKHSMIYSVQWDDDGKVELVPSGHLTRTKHHNLDFILKCSGASDSQQNKVSKVMREYKSGKLKSSSGHKVTSRDQAVAIALSEAGLSKNDLKRKGGRKTGPRLRKRNPADLTLQEQRRKRKKTSKGIETQGEVPVSEKNKINEEYWDVEKEVACLGCGKKMEIDMNSVQPFRCGDCKEQFRDGTAIVNSPIFKR